MDNVCCWYLVLFTHVLLYVQQIHFFSAYIQQSQAWLPRVRMHEGVKQLVLSICLSISQSVSLVKNFEI